MRVVTYLVVRFNDVPVDAAGVFVVHLTMTDILFILFLVLAVLQKLMDHNSHTAQTACLMASAFENCSS